MKKVLLTFAICLPFLVQAQSRLKITTPQAPASKMIGVKANCASTEWSAPKKVKKGKASSVRTATYNPIGTVIGTTTYDFQTSASVARRILKYSSGQISVVWNFSTDDTLMIYSDLGSAYVNFDGTMWASQPAARIEANRSGWPAIVTNAANQEIIVSHYQTMFPNLQLNTNQGIGNTNWTQTSPFPWTSYKYTNCPRASSVDDNIYIVDNETDTSYADSANGIKQPMYYSRSTDGGITFVDDHIFLPGYDSTRYYRGQPDVYAIDSKDNYVVVGLAGFGNDVAFWKSTDYGATFAKTIASPFPLSPYFDQLSDINNDGIPDTIDTNDNTCDVLLDLNGNVHMWYGYTRLFNPTGGYNTTQFFPASNAIMYYSEQYDSLQVMAGVVDCDFDQILTFGDLTINSNWGDQGAGYDKSSLATMPMGMVDNNGNIYCIYSSIHEGADSTYDGQNFRDIMVSMSDDGGLTWIPEQNLTNDDQSTIRYGSEEIYASVNRYSDDGYMHITFMCDDEPGNSYRNLDDPRICEIRYQKYDLPSIITGSFGPCGRLGVGLNESKSLKNNEINAFPNPTSGFIEFEYNLIENSSAKITISNALGQSVMTIANGTFAAGSHTVNANLSTLEAGVYFYTFTTENSVITRKLVVTK